MSTLATLTDCLRLTRRAESWRDKRLTFLLAGVGVLGAHRQRLRRAYLRWINAAAQNGVIRLSLRVNGVPTTIELRENNEADCLVACEFVRGFYELPPFTPERIVDVGANSGMFSVHAARHFPEARLACFEPDGGNFRLLQRNLTLNGISAELHHAGVWSRSGVVYYHAQESHTGFVDEHPPGVEIPCEIPVIGPGCWLKLDAEGAEYAVLPALFARGELPKWISMEIHDFRRRGASLLTLLRENGYLVSGGNDPATECAVISAQHA